MLPFVSMAILVIYRELITAALTLALLLSNLETKLLEGGELV
jgi:hypothetical protein